MVCERQPAYATEQTEGVLLPGKREAGTAIFVRVYALKEKQPTVFFVHFN